MSERFVNPIKLEFEKVYYPYLLMNKKRYAGLYWTNSKHWDKMDTKGKQGILVQVEVEMVGYGYVHAKV